MSKRYSVQLAVAMAVAALSASAAHAADPVTIYQHANYQGQSRSFSPGKYDMKELGIPNDSLSSARVPVGMRILLFQHAGFRGESLELRSDTPFVGVAWNDVTSSVWVIDGRRAVTLFKDKYYQGLSRTFPPGLHNLEELGIGNDQLSSVRVSSGTRVRLFKHRDFKEEMAVLTSSKPRLPDVLDDKVSSIIVE